MTPAPSTWFLLLLLETKTYITGFENFQDWKHFHKISAWNCKSIGLRCQRFRGFGVCFCQGASFKVPQLVPWNPKAGVWIIANKWLSHWTVDKRCSHYDFSQHSLVFVACFTGCYFNNLLLFFTKAKWVLISALNSFIYFRVPLSSNTQPK